MKVLIFGGNGMLGHKLVGQLKKEFDVYTSFRKINSRIRDLEFFSGVTIFENVSAEIEDSYLKLLKDVKPDVIINAVGIIKQLPTSKNVIKTLTVNSIFPHRLAEIAQNVGARTITISTDCVFSGHQGNYTEADESDAKDLYGKSKNLGELVEKDCLTLRTSIIGRELETSHSLIEWFLSRRGTKIQGYTNAIYTGFPTVVLSRIISDIIKNQPDLSGLYHVSSNPINKYELLCLVRDAFGVDVEIEPFDDFRIDRSLNSEKFSLATGFIAEDWKTLIAEMAKDAEGYDETRKFLAENR